MKTLIAAALATAAVLALPAVRTAPAHPAEPPSPPAAASAGHPSAECAQREAMGKTPCSEAEYRAEAAKWFEYYGCDPRGCGYIDYEAVHALLPEPVAEPVSE